MTVQELAQKSGRDITLDNVSSQRAYIPPEGWQNVEVSLSENDRREIAEMLGGWHKTRDAVFYGLQYLAHLPSWMKGRIMYSPITNRWSYCAGQDYTVETALIRRKIAG